MGDYEITEYETVSKTETRVQCNLCSGVSEESDPELWCTLSATPEVEVRVKEDKFAHYGVTEEDVTRYISMLDSAQRSELRRNLVRRDRHAGETVTLSPDGKTGHWAHGSVHVKLKHDGEPRIDLCPGCLESALGPELMAETLGREVSREFAEELFERHNLESSSRWMTIPQFVWVVVSFAAAVLAAGLGAVMLFGTIAGAGAVIVTLLLGLWIWNNDPRDTGGDDDE